MHYHGDVVEKIDLSLVLETAESVCGELGIKTGKSWKANVTELTKFPWTNLYISFQESKDWTGHKSRKIEF